MALTAVLMEQSVRIDGALVLWVDDAGIDDEEVDAVGVYPRHLLSCSLPAAPAAVSSPSAVAGRVHTD